MTPLREIGRSVAASVGLKTSRLFNFLGRPPIDKGTQLLLQLRYEERRRQGLAPLSFRDVGFRAFSQADEDGILHYLFSTIGTTNRITVEMCVEDGIECNSANLLINHGWRGLLFDGGARNVRRGRKFYARNLDTWLAPPALIQAWIDAENVNKLITDNGIRGEIDLFSLDIDGVDYWVWKALDVITPRVVVVEYRQHWGGTRAVTVPYRRDFVRPHLEYFGASLPAFVKVGREKGYRLVGSSRHNINAFFVRNDVAADYLPEVSASSCSTYPDDVTDEATKLPVGAAFPWESV